VRLSSFSPFSSSFSFFYILGILRVRKKDREREKSKEKRERKIGKKCERKKQDKGGFGAAKIKFLAIFVHSKNLR